MKSASCCEAFAAADVINSATPVETDLLGVHPRLLADEAGFETLRGRLGIEPWAGWFSGLKRGADRALVLELPAKLIGTSYAAFDIRQLGEQLIHLALVRRLTGEASYLERVRFLMGRLADEPDWGHSLIFGHWARGFAFALDWLWDDFDEAERGRHVETLHARARQVFEHWAAYRSGEPFGYTWNISAVVLGGLAAAAACLYGERPDIAPLANMAWEKMRLQSAALGPDGVSPEGIMYGGYYASYLTVGFLLAERMFGIDLFGTTPWLAAHARAIHAQTIPRASWKADDLFFQQGDAHGYSFGYEGILRILASRLKDGGAQWFADEILRAGAMGAGPFSFLLYDPEVRPDDLTRRPPFDRLDDFGIAVMRSDWSATGSACAIKCGPNVGHHAARRFTHPLGGGHMQPNNGEVQIFSHGEWILRHPGYVFKDTAYHNTLLVDGRGQYGEKSEWFEDLPYRRRRRYPVLSRAEHHEGWDYAVADLIEAYPGELGLVSLKRHFVYIRPGTWILVDAVAAARPVSVTALFHGGFPFKAVAEGLFAGRGERAGASLRIREPAAVECRTEEQVRLHSSGHAEGTLFLLAVAPAAPAARHLLVTEIRAYPAGASAPEGLGITFSGAGADVRIRLDGIGLEIAPWAG